MSENYDGEIRFNTKIDTTEAEKNAQNMGGKLNKSLKGSVSSFLKLGGAVATFTAATKLAIKTIKETTEAFQKQKTAEVQLEAAAKNNPYLDSTSVRQLKDYASALQSISTTGDEELLPLMGQLAAQGRTQAEIQNIMKTALDMSASGVMSLESAVHSLNLTFEGNTTQLGKMNPELKALTEEELKNGKAVEVLGKKFDGISQTVAEATGSQKQFKNAVGDLKEEVGAYWEDIIKLPRKYATEVITAVASSKKAARELREYNSQLVEGTLEANTENIAAYQRQVNDLQALLHKTKSIKTRNYRNDLWREEDIKRELAQDPEVIALTEQLTKARNNLAKATEELEKKEKARLQAQKDAEEQEKKAAEDEKKKAANDEAVSVIEQNKKALEQSLKRLELEAKLKGEEVDQQEKLNILMESYVDLVTSSNQVTEKNSYAIARRLELEDFANSLPTDTFKKWEEEVKKLMDEVMPKAEETTAQLVESVQKELDDLDGIIENYTDKESEEYQKYVELRENMEEAMTELTKRQARERAEAIADEMQKNAEYLESLASTIENISTVISNVTQSRTDEELTALSKMYLNGEKSYEEYCEEKARINKKALTDEYKMNLASWGLQLATAIANGAAAIIKAFAEGGTVAGLLMSAATASQIAVISSQRPKAPQFAEGGIVPGGNLYGDKVLSRLNSSEMVITTEQQKKLWDFISNGSQGGGGVSLNVEVENNRGNDTQVNTYMTERGFKLTIDQIVNQSAAKGVYTESLNNAEALNKGVNYL